MRLTTSTHRVVAVLAYFSATALLASCGGSNGSSPTGPSPPPVTQIASLSPPSVQAGSPAFELTINGTNFDPSCAITWLWNGGASLATYSNVFVSSTELQVQIPASQVAEIGFIEVILSCQDGGPNTQFPVTGFPRIQINEAANDLVWDPIHQVIYLSVPPTVPDGSGIAVLDPVTATITSFVPLGNNPDVLAISDDGQYLYVGLDDTSSIQRFTLPELTADIEFPIGQTGNFPFDIQVLPGAPHTTAVSIGIPDTTTPASGGVTIFDDGTPRPTSVPGAFAGGTGNCFCGSLQWGPAPSELYSNNSMDTGFDFYNLSVDSSGVTISKDTPNVFSSFNGYFWNNIHYLPSTGLIYSDDRHVVNPSTATVVGIFSSIPFGASNLNRMVPDSELNVAAFLSPIDCIYNGIGSCYVVATYRLSDFSTLNSFTMSNIEAEAGVVNMVRWGPSGLAFNTDTGQIYLVDISTLLQPGSTSGASRRPSQRLPALHNSGKVLTTTMRRFPATISNKVR
jgi:hypothetical protein